MIGGIPIEHWRKAFACATSIAIDKDYFSDILFYELYPNASEEDSYDEKWNFVNEAFKEIFGVDRNLI